MTMTIYTDGNVVIDGRHTGLHVTQRRDGTVLYRPEVSALAARSLRCEPQPYQEITLPHKRYSLAHPKPLSGNPGCDQLEADVRAYLAQVQA